MMTSTLRELRRANLAALAGAEPCAAAPSPRRWFDLFRRRHWHARWSW